jgi:hypothetical protein
MYEQGTPYRYHGVYNDAACYDCARNSIRNRQSVELVVFLIVVRVNFLGRAAPITSADEGSEESTRKDILLYVPAYDVQYSMDLLRICFDINCSLSCCCY